MSDREDTPMEDIENADGEPSDIAQALGLHRVGTAFPSKKTQAQQPIQVLNARGMPARIRKKNKLFFDDNIVNEKPHRMSPSKKNATKLASPIKSPGKILKKRKSHALKYMKVNKMRSTERTKQQDESDESNEDDKRPSNIMPPVIEVDRKVGQEIGLRLRNLLKLPKAHKWVSYEWFYSYIDKPLFEGDNDFQCCLKESFPQLKTRMLTRCEWSKLRKMMGKPRRCSQAFFDEERRELERRRQKIRFLQSQKACDVSYAKDLPSEIPLPLPIATKVTARLREPQDGIFTGSIDAVDSLSSIYRITFDRPGLGTHSVPDYEVIANDYSDTLSVSTITQSLNHEKQLCRQIKNELSLNKSDPLLGSEIFKTNKMFMFSKETIGGFQPKLLELIIRTKKTLGAKQMKLLRLKNMNSEAETYRSYGEEFRDDFQRQYASIIVGMKKLNRDMQLYISQIQLHAKDLAKDTKLVSMLAPSYLREKCKELANESVDKNNQVIKNPAMLRLITDLATVMWIASNMSADDKQLYVLNVLEGYMEEVKASLEPDNIPIFQKNVQVHMRQTEIDLARQTASQ